MLKATALALLNQAPCFQTIRTFKEQVYIRTNKQNRQLQSMVGTSILAITKGMLRSTLAYRTFP